MQEVLQFNDFIYTLHLRPDDMPKVISVQKKGIIVVAFCRLVGRDIYSNETDSSSIHRIFSFNIRLLSN
jgi:hypothetical protein